MTLSFKKLFYAVAMSLTAAGFSACNNSPAEYITSQAVSNSYLYVKDSQNPGALTTLSGVGYAIEFNYTENTANVVMTGFALPGGSSYPAMTFKGLSFRQTSDGWKEITGTDVIPQLTGISQAPRFSSFRLRIVDRYLALPGTSQMQYCPAMDARYVVNDRYVFNGSNPVQILSGSTTVSDAGGANPFTHKGAYYTFNLDPVKKVAAITISNIRFATAMPAVNMVLREVPYTVEGANLNFNAASVVPEVDGQAQAGYTITDFNGTLDIAQSMRFSFHCMGKTVQVSGTYTEVE